MKLASTREGPRADEGFLSAQVNCGISLPVHKDKNKFDPRCYHAVDTRNGRLRRVSIALDFRQERGRGYLHHVTLRTPGLSGLSPP